MMAIYYVVLSSFANLTEVSACQGRVTRQGERPLFDKGENSHQICDKSKIPGEFPRGRKAFYPTPTSVFTRRPYPQPNFRSLCPSAVHICTLCPLFQLPCGPKPYYHPQVSYIHKNASHEDRKRRLRLAEGLERPKPHPLLLDYVLSRFSGKWACVVGSGSARLF